jgi:hypothetical protein
MTADWVKFSHVEIMLTRYKHLPNAFQLQGKKPNQSVGKLQRVEHRGFMGNNFVFDTIKPVPEFLNSNHLKSPFLFFVMVDFVCT